MKIIDETEMQKEKKTKTEKNKGQHASYLENLKKNLMFLNKRYHNIKFTAEKQINQSIAFLDVSISGINGQNITLQTYHKSTYTGLLLNFKSFTSFSYKISLIKCLVDRLFKSCNNCNSFHNNIESIISNLIKIAYPPFLIEKVIKKYLNCKFSSNQNQLKNTFDVHYFKYHISATCRTILKIIEFQNFAKSFVKKILTLS